MNRFIAYFDYLGFKDFIDNNNLEEQSRIMNNNFRDMEHALGKGKLKTVRIGVIADLSDSRINCINFSDTVVFFTNDNSENSLKEILEVAYEFNFREVVHCFPVRGALVYGEMAYVDHKQSNGYGGVYNVNSVYGKGLVKAHLRAEEQNWAGTLIDVSFIEEIESKGYNIETYLSPYAKKYIVPYKDEIKRQPEYVLSLIEGTLDDEALKNFSQGIKDNFGYYNKSTNDIRVQKKITNTIEFLNSYYKKE